LIARYTHEAMTALWSDQSRYRAWFDVELAACRAMEEEDVVPAGTADVVAPVRDRIDAHRIDTIEATTRHDVIAFLTHIEELAGPSARWLHLGLTSSDILDTSMALLVTHACNLILGEAEEFALVLRRRADELRDVAMVGRTHGIHAEPTSCGVTFALWYAELQRNMVRMRRARDAMSVGKLAGAVGTYANVSPQVEARALAALGLRPETVATQVVQRDRYAELVFAVAQMASGIEKMAVTIRGWQRTEVGEAHEPFGRGQKGSSAMPHKKNPILSENLCGLARVTRGYVTTAIENNALWHERDISHSSAERMMIPDVTSVLHFMLRRAKSLADGLVIHRDRMAQNLDLTGGLIYSQSVLLELVRRGLPRQKAYEAVQRCALSDGSDVTFRQRLSEDPLVSAHLSGEELERLFDVGYHLRHVGRIIDRAIGAAESRS